MKYQVIRTCEDCKNEDIFEFTKIQSAFKLYKWGEIWDKQCSKCNSTKCYSLRHPYVKLDKEILDIWGNDEKLFLEEQDEEIILAEMRNLELILESINDDKYLKSKIEILIASLCVLLYDNSSNCEEYSEIENKEREKNSKIILPELIKLKNRIKDMEEYLMDYIKVVVFPQIEIK